MDLKEAALVSVIKRHPWELARLAIASKHLRKIFADLSGRKAHPKGKKIKVLDIGSGDLFVVSELARQNPEVEFIAIDNHFTPAMMEELQIRLKGLNIKLYASLEEFSKGNDPLADVITILDVLEHIEDHSGFLENLIGSGFAGKETRLLIFVPAYQKLFTQHDVFLEHYRRYNCRTLAEVTKNSGFEKINNGYFFFLLLSPRIFGKLKEKIFGPSKKPGTGLTQWKGGSFITGFIKLALLSDYSITSLFNKIGIRIPGLSTYILCKPSA